jgi:ketosteroid isomerase-like protein
MISRLVMTGCVMAGLLSAQDKGKAKVERFDFRPLMQQIWDAWGTLNPANTAKFYSKDAKRTFFDLAPMKYTGWSEYEAGVKKMFADYSSAKFTLYAGGHVAQRGNFAWAEDTGHGTLVKKSGAKEDLDFRWTVLWEKEGSDWLIIHEHISVPMGGSAPPAKPAVVPPVSGSKAATAPKK